MSPTFVDDCVFCDRAKIKAEMVEEMYGADGSLHWVFEPLEPVVTGHLLVVPAQHVQDATESPLVTSMAAGVAARVAMRYRASNVITSVGLWATQSIFHLHLHVVPRRMGDGLGLPWTAQRQGIRREDLEHSTVSLVDVVRAEQERR